MNRVFFIVALAVLGAHSSLGFSQAYCRGNEEPVFACRIKDKKAELCYSKAVNGFVYRFKKGVVVQLQYPRMPGERDPFKFSSRPYAGGGEAHIRFENGGYTYFTYDKDVKDSDGGLNFTAGIMVKKGAKKVADMQCENDAPIHSEAYELLPKEDYKDIGVQ